jgi:hypothetical protein
MGPGSELQLHEILVEAAGCHKLAEEEPVATNL